MALPWLSVNSQYCNLRAALQAGSITQQQLYNVVQMAVVSDPSLAIPLGVVQGASVGATNAVVNAEPDFSAAFYANDNNKVMLEAWLALPVPATASIQPGELTTTGFGPQLVPIGPGAGGWPAPPTPQPGQLQPPT
jgi:hypothetical protein